MGKPTETRLTKPFRLVYNEDTKEIITSGQCVTWTAQPCFEFDTRAELDAKIKELGLKEPKEEVGFPEKKPE